jgi:hypothetical protein
MYVYIMMIDHRAILEVKVYDSGYFFGLLSSQKEKHKNMFFGDLKQ